jgi:two-component system OmpR family response regulator/two-component system response regulator QseB
MRILVVEDDMLLGDGIKAGLAQAGYSIDWVKDGVSADLALKDTRYDAVVLDLGLPRLAGLEVLKRLRERANAVPVLILTARDAIEDRVTGLDSGADDYVVKPFDLHELGARLRALLRRAAGQAAPRLTVGELELDAAAHEVKYNGQTLDLSPREFALLHALMLNAGRVLTREQLSERLYAWGDEIESNAIDVHIHHLRRKISPDCIRTLRGVGYLMPRELHG